MTGFSLTCFSQYEIKTELSEYASRLKSLNITLVKPLDVDWSLESGVRLNFILGNQIDPDDLEEGNLAFGLNSFLNGGIDLGIVRNIEYVDIAFLTGYQYNSLNISGYSCSGFEMIQDLAVCNDYGIYELNRKQHTINLRLRASHKIDLTVKRKNKIFIEPALTFFARSFNFFSGEPDSFITFEDATRYQPLSSVNNAYSEGVLNYDKFSSTFLQLNLFLGYRF